MSRCETGRSLAVDCGAMVRKTILLPISHRSSTGETNSSVNMGLKVLTGSKRTIDDCISFDRKRQRKGFSFTEHRPYKTMVGLSRNSPDSLENSPTTDFKDREQQLPANTQTNKTDGRPNPGSQLDTTTAPRERKHQLHSSTATMDGNEQAERECESSVRVSLDEEKSDSTEEESFSRESPSVDDEPELDISKAPQPKADVDPDSYIRELVSSILCFTPKISPALSLPSNFFRPVTDEQLSQYTCEVVSATRENKVDEIRNLHSSGRSLDCCNRFGESLLHMACRRGYADMVDFLLNEAHLSVRIRDDCGRSPLHDACWHCSPQYDIVDSILRVDPYLLFIGDKRGHSPFAYARREHWAYWNQFLYDRRDVICYGMLQDLSELKSIFCKDDAKVKC